MYRWLYFSPLGFFISFFLNLLGRFMQPFMVYGCWNRPEGKFQRATRISSTACILNRRNFDIGDNVFIGHHSVIDCSAAVVRIGDGVQTGAWCGFFTHGSHISIRLLGSEYIHTPSAERVGYVRAPVEIGSYTYVGSSALIMPGVKVGKGCIISAGAVVTTDMPDFSVVKGNPARVIGCALTLDSKYFDDESVRQSYFDQEIIKKYLREKE